MAIQYVGGQVAGRAGANSTTTVTYALTGGLASVPAAGDLVIITAIVGSQGRNPAQAITAPATWTALGQLNPNTTTYDTSLNVSRKFMPATPNTTFTLPSTGNVADAQRYTIQVFRGVDPTNPLDVAAVSATGTATGRPNPGSITPTTAGAWVVICGGGAAATGAAYTAPANFTTNFLTGFTADTNDAMVGSGYWSGWTSGAVDPAQYTGGTTNAVDSWAAYTIALRPAVNNYSLTAQGGSYSVTGGTASLLRSKKLVASGGSYSLTGSSAILTKAAAGGTVLQSVYEGSGDNATSTTTIATTITGVAAGSAIIAFVGDGGGSTVTVTVSDGTSYTQSADGRCRDTGNSQNSNAFYLLNAGSGSHTVTATFSTAVPFRRLLLVEVAGLATTSAEDRAANQYQAAPGNATDGISSSATAATTNANDFVIGLTQNTGSSGAESTTLNAGTGYALIGSRQMLTSEYKNVSATGAQTATFTDGTNSFPRTTHVIAFKVAAPASTYTLTANGGSYALTGSSAVVSRNRKLTSSGGSYSLTGASAVVSRNRKLTATGGAYTLTGGSANLSRNRKLTASGGSYSLSGGTANLLRSKYVAASGGAYTLTGSSAVLTWTAGSVNYTFTLLGGSYSVTGSSAVVSRNRNMTATGGTYSLTGGSANLLRSKRIVSTGGSYALTGASANLLKSKRIVSTGGAYNLTGGTANLLRSKRIVSTGGSYTLTGASANLVKGRVLTAQGGAYSLTGASATLLRSKLVVAQGGSYTLTGSSAVLTWTSLAANYTLTALGGSYSLTGSSATLLRSKRIQASGGSYTLTGASATLLRSKYIQSSGGAYSVTGSQAIITKVVNYTLIALGGSYDLIGANSTLLKSKYLQTAGGEYNLTGGSAIIINSGDAASQGQSGVSRLARSNVWKPVQTKLPREFVEELQAKALEEDAKRKVVSEPPPVITTPKTRKVKPQKPVTAVPVRSARTYTPHIVSPDDPWEKIYAKINETYLQISNDGVQYQRIRDEAQSELDEEDDIEFLLLHY